MTSIRRLTVADWRTARAVRLDALRESPAALGSSLAHEAEFADDRWRARLSGAWWLAEAGSAPAGFASGVRDPGTPAERQVESLWVDPELRGCGLGQALLDAAAAWARAEGASRLTLWAPSGSGSATGLFERAGFVREDRADPQPSGTRPFYARQL